MTELETRKLMMAIRVVYQWFYPCDAAVRVWHRILADHEYAEIGTALGVILQSARKDPPTPGDLIDLVRRSKATRYPTAAEAWDRVVALAGRSTRWEDAKTLLSDNPRAIIAARSTGYDRIRYADKFSELPFVRRDFVEAYNSIGDAAEKAVPLIAFEDARVKALIETTAERKAIG